MIAIPPYLDDLEKDQQVGCKECIHSCMQAEQQNVLLELNAADADELRRLWFCTDSFSAFAATKV